MQVYWIIAWIWLYLELLLYYFWFFFNLYLVLKDTQCEFIKYVFKVLMLNNQILAKQKAVVHFDFETHVNFRVQRVHIGYKLPYQSTVCPFPFLHVHFTWSSLTVKRTRNIHKTATSWISMVFYGNAVLLYF